MASPSPARRSTQAQITRALKAAKAAGVSVRVTIRPDGTMILDPVIPVDATTASDEGWDSVK